MPSPAQVTNMTISGLADTWLADRVQTRNWSPDTVRNYRLAVGQFVAFLRVQKLVQDDLKHFTPRNAADFAAYLANAGLKPQSVGQKLSALTSLGRYATKRLDGDGFQAWDEVKRNGWEGLVAKNENSRYVGGRSRSWVKVKVRREGRFVVVGMDMADGYVSSLLLAARRGRILTYVGRVEWGVTRGAVEQTSRAAGGASCPRAWMRRGGAASCGLSRASWSRSATPS